MQRDKKGRFIKGKPPWNKGLTKDDPRVASYVNKNIKKKIDKSCLICGTDFKVIPSRELTAQFCSRKCKAVWYGKKREMPDSFHRRNWNEYVKLHHWVTEQLGQPQFCVMCGKQKKQRYHWANKSGEYKKDINDWLRLCPKCHSKYDKKT